MALVIKPMQTFGDSRTRDVFHRHNYQSVAATDASTAVTVDHNFYGITAATGSAHTASSQFELAKIQVNENAADGYASTFNVKVNSGVGATVDQTVASLSKAGANFTADKLSADFGSSFTSVTTKGLGRDGTTAAVTQTMLAGASPVSLLATPNRLHIAATDTQVGGQLTIQKDQLNWVQEGGTAGYKLSAANDQYVYTHGSGTNSSGTRTFTLDGFNVDNTPMTAGGFAFNSFNAAGSSEPVMSIGAGAATGQQLFNISNSYVGIGQAASTSKRLAVLGDVAVTGSQTISADLSVAGNLNVTGTVTTVNSTSINVGDKDINLAVNSVSSADLDQGGLILGAVGTDAVYLTYDDTLKAWSSSINYNAAVGKVYEIAGGSGNVGGTTLSATQLAFNTPNATLTFDAQMSLAKNNLTFTDPASYIDFGGTRLTKDGFTSASDTAAVVLGSAKEWRMQIETVGTDKYLSFEFSSDGGSTYVTKFSISP